MNKDAQLAKKLARDHARNRRRADRTVEDEDCASTLLHKFIGKLSGPCIVSGYMPIHSEISPLGAMRACFEDGYRICLPVVSGKGQPLEFREWSPTVELKPGCFGALVPASGCQLRPEILIVPLLAFDSRGYRLGYGGGFYDRTLAALRRGGPVKAVGFAFSCQEFKAVPQNSHDERLDAVVTEREIRYFD